jgi:exodeoxyribonuclease VII small subunit
MAAARSTCGRRERTTLSKKTGELRFRQGLESLERVVQALESDDLELEEALDQYQQGLTLYRRLCDILAKAEERIEALSGERGGKLLWKEFPAAAGGGEGEQGQKPDESPDERSS